MVVVLGVGGVADVVVVVVVVGASDFLSTLSRECHQGVSRNPLSQRRSRGGHYGGITRSCGRNWCHRDCLSEDLM